MALDFPSSPTIGDIYNANNSTWKWDGVSWNVTNYLIGTGTGLGTDTVFFINGQSVNTAFTTNASYNYFSAGPVVLNADVTITTGSRWVVV